MKIGLLLSSPPGYSETFFTSKIKGLQAQGHSVLLITAATSQQFTGCKHKTHPRVAKSVWMQLVRFLLVGITLLPYLQRVIRYIKLERNEGTSLKRVIEKTYLNATLLKLDVDWLHFGFATMAIDRELVAKAIGAKMAVSFRGFDIAIYPLKHPNCYHKLWKFVDKVHTISNDLLVKAHALGLPKSISFQKITPAIDVAFFNNNSLAKSVEQPIHFLTVGRLHWKKGYVQMLEALAELKQNGTNFTYSIIGGGSKRERERIAFAALQLDLTDEVIFKGILDSEAIKEEYKKADIYLQYSISEGFCNAVLEAQAMGLLCIVSNAEGLSENVLHNQSGWVVPMLNPLALKTQIEYVLNLSDTIQTINRQQAKDRVRKEFTIEKQQQEFVKFYT